jgi:transaldolase
MHVADLRTQIFADGADLSNMVALAADPRISGFTTNPTLMKQAGLSHYSDFALRILDVITEQPISFEVCADDPEEIRQQARTIAKWADNVYVKVPVTTTRGETLGPVVRDLSLDGIKVNVTALFTIAQVESTVKALEDGAPAFVSVFAGRIADAGVDPIPIMAEAVQILDAGSQAKLIWASPREVLNLIQANGVGCHVITMTHDLLKKLDGIGKDLTQFSLETVQMFFRDAAAAGLAL